MIEDVHGVENTRVGHCADNFGVLFAPAGWDVRRKFAATQAGSLKLWDGGAEVVESLTQLIKSFLLFCGVHKIVI